MAKKASGKSKGEAKKAAGPRVYELVAFIIGGPMTDEFIDANPEVSRTILIRGNQTLEDLHETIFDALGRFDEHMYEFQIGGKGPMDPDARRYVLPMDAEDDFDSPKPAGLVTETTIDDLGVEKGDVFGYWFDFGDDWWHQIDVEAIHEGEGEGEYPRVTAAVGENPPQYPDLEDEDEEDDEDEFEDEDELEDEEDEDDEEEEDEEP